MEDEKIIELYWIRDQSAIGMTSEKYGQGLHRLALRVLHIHEDAEESVNDTYFRAWNTIPPSKPQYLFAYLAKICRFAAFEKLDWLNAQKRKAEVVELTVEMELCIPSAYEDSRIEGEEIGRLLDAFLADLNKEQRIIFLRRYWYGDAVSEIAKALGVGGSKVKTSLFRTRNKLRDFLEKEGVDL